jgi:restriction endonuclease
MGQVLAGVGNVDGHTPFTSITNEVDSDPSELRHMSRRMVIREGPGIKNVDQAQNDIRWEALLYGQVSTLWKDIQHQYFLFMGKRNSGEGWVRLSIQNSGM